MSLSVIIFECNTVDNPRDWWIETSATHHICADKTMFSNYHKQRGEQLLMGNSTSSKVEELGKITLKMNS